MPSFYEFFAGAGMARAGLGKGWSCLFSNDFDHKKAASYILNWGDDELKVTDIRALKSADLPGSADLAWASFPCQDLSLAGGGAGLKGDRSGTFWPFWALIKSLAQEGRSPRLIVLENVCGTLTSHGGRDFAAICGAFTNAGYNLGAVVIDAVRFVPQSRPRLFIIAVRADTPIQGSLVSEGPFNGWHPRTLLSAQAKLPPAVRKAWIWWRLPEPSPRKKVLADLIEANPQGVSWHTAEETAKLLAMMSDINRAKLEEAKRQSSRIIGAVYKRTRRDEYGRKAQRAEVRFDNISGCLRTPAGGSSRQVILVVENDSVRSRLISPRETARLMGLPERYKLPLNYNEAYHLTGDGVAVPVVRHLAKHIFEQILTYCEEPAKAAA